MSTEKENLISAIEELTDLMRIAGENDFKIRAYDRAADVIAREISSVDDLRDVANGARKLAGIGDGIRSAIAEFLERGVLSAAEALKVEVPAVVQELTAIPGLGAKKARLIVDELGVGSVGELEYACRENRLVTLKGFGAATQAKILASIERMKRNQGHFLISEAHAMADAVGATFPAHWHWQKVGELGRSCDVVSRFSFAVAGATKKELQEFQSTHKTLDALELTAIEKPFEELALLDRQRLMSAQSVVDTLNARGTAMTTKEGAPWEYSWLEDVWMGRDPRVNTYRRAVHGTVKGVFHNHTNRSDGSATLEEMVNEAERLGYEYIGISDHSQSAFYARGLKAEELLMQHEEIKKLQKKTKIHIFHGVESDILADGALDYPKDVLEKLDFIVGSVHSRFQMDEKTMTERLVKALSNPLITFWGHPTGRLLLGRDPYGFDWQAVCKAARKSGVVFELNANPHRLDVDWRMGERLMNEGISICINPDAHSTAGLQDTQWGERMAEKAMMPVSSVLNLMGVTEIEHWLRERRNA